MKKLILVLLSVFVVTVANASEHAKVADVETLLKITKSEKMLDSIYAQTGQMMLNMGKQMGIQPSEHEYLVKMSKKLSTLLRTEVTWDKFKGPLIDIYTQNYSEQEVKDIIAFYQSDSGQSMIDKMPKIMQESMQLSQGIMVQLMPKIREMARDLEIELKEARKAQ